MENTSGEVVCDSILQNKHKTKSYWEQLMMAAVTSEQPGRTPCHSPDRDSSFDTVKTKDILSLNSDGENSKPQSELSEQEFYDARSQMSLSSPSEPLDSLDTSAAAPKIVESVAKKLFLEAEVIQTKHAGNTNDEESVIEREIRLQKDKEEALAKERQEALLRVAVISLPASTQETPEPANKQSISATKIIPVLANAETKIALELREMRRREEELRRQRQKLRMTNGTSHIKQSDQAADDVFNSIPNTDEDKFPEYGSEERELSMDGNSSQMTSPEVSVSLNHRTQSMESMSSIHSSGSGEIAGFSTRRRVTVKPLAEPEDEDTPVYMRNQKETPIEREIRLAREREEEFRREKLLVSLNSQPTAVPATSPEVQSSKGSDKSNTNEPGIVQHKLATGRIQQEINEATQREKEFREAGMLQTVSEDAVDSKVAHFGDLTELSVEEREEKVKKYLSASQITSAGSHTSRPAVEKQLTTVHSPISQKSGQSTSNLMGSRKFQNSPGQKGLMQRFIASRGKMNGIVSSSFVSSSPVTSQSPSPSHTATPNSNKTTDTLPEQVLQYYESDKEPFEIQRSQTRRGYISAEEKIQVELLEMQKREEELRLQRACLFARSQPNLLCLVEGDDDSVETPGTVEPQTQLRSSLSNPNLLDSDNSLPLNDDLSLKKPSGKTARRRSALIAQWENRIQQYIEH